MLSTQKRMELLETYKDHIQRQLLPFWHKAIDGQVGGIFTCYSNDGSTQVSRDKYTWSQGRYVWLWSRLAECCGEGLLEGEAESYLREAGRTIRFLRDHAVLDNGNCAFLLSEDGTPKEPIPGKGYDTSFFADCFVVMGASEYARVSGDADILEWTLQRFDSIMKRLATNTQRSEPYPIPSGLEAHSVSMIMLNVSQELAEALAAAGHVREQEMRRYAAEFLDRILNRFVQADGTVAELVATDERLADTVMARHLNPGHTIECMWFAMTEANRIGGMTEAIEKTVRVTKRAFELGWDDIYGGLLHYVDRYGGPPQGRETGGDGFERNIIETWDAKLWWPHSEALYTLLLGYELTGDPELMELYERTHAYTFATFPHPDPVVGEWIQIRDRAGEPLTKVVALPVKDPYHILRNFILIVELLSRSKAG